MGTIQRALLVPGTLVLAASLAPSSGRAADHVDAPAVIADPAADITDVYAWPSDDGRTLRLVLNIPAAMFSDVVQYVFHLESIATYGGSGAQTSILCRFSPEQTVECWAGDDVYVRGDASSPTGVRDEQGRIRVFAGQRDDPFFFNSSGFRATIEAVRGAAGGLTFDEAGCPALDAATSTALVTQLQSEPDGSPAQDDFAGGTVASLVIEVDRAVVGAEPIAAVWASTRR